MLQLCVPWMSWKQQGRYKEDVFEAYLFGYFQYLHVNEKQRKQIKTYFDNLYQRYANISAIFLS